MSATLVNSCHPWFGAAVGGDPGAASDKISQFTYIESQVGRQFDLYHTYHSPGSIPLSSDEIHFAERANTYDYVNWKPASNWADADGSNASVNASIKNAADNIKAIAPHKIFLTVWHEPQNDVSSFDNTAEQTACQDSTTFTGLKGSAGTPAQYQAMWQNVRNIFNAEGVTNVVWVMNYQGYKNWDCLIPSMWPGNSLVDWVTMDSYGSGTNPTWAASVGHTYGVLQADSTAIDNFDSKPWGSAEFNVDCSDSSSNVTGYFASAKAALDANSYPRLKMYMVYSSANGPGGTAGCLVDRNATVLSAFKSFANDPIFTNEGTTTPLPGRTTPPASGGGSGPADSGTSTPAPPHTAPSESTTSSSTASGGAHGGSAQQRTGTKPSVGGTVSLVSGSDTTTTVKVDGKTVSGNGRIDTTYLTNGSHTVTLTVKHPNGTTSTVTRTITVHNQLNPLQRVRNVLFGGLRGNPTLMNASFGVSMVVVLVLATYGLVFFRIPQFLLLRLQKLRNR